MPVNIVKYDIGVSRAAPIYFSHVIDRSWPSHHNFHLHDYVEIFFYVSGDADFILNDTYLQLRPGDVIIAPENVLHRPIIKSEASYERYYIGLPRATFSHMDRVRDPLSQVTGGGQTLIRPDEETGAQLLRHLHKITTLIEERQEEAGESGATSREDDGRGVRMYAELLRLLHTLGGDMRRGALREWEGEPHLPSLIARTLPYLEAHVSRINSVEELAQVLGVTPSYLSDLFSRSMKVPLKQYITAKKIALAKARLQEGDSVTDTAFACGFCTVSHFIVVFRRVTGMTPSAYRKRVAGQRY